MIGIIVASVVVIVLVGVIAKYQERAAVEQLGTRIDQFREQHGRLPNPENHEEMRAWGFELRVGWHPDFVALNTTDYELWLYYGFDGPHSVYSSREKAWREEL